MFFIRQNSGGELRRFAVLSSLMALFMLVSGCIKNDLPYPRIAQEILAIAVEDQTSSADIDKTKFQVTVHLAETTNPAEVKFTEYEYTEGAETSLNLLDGTYDLSEPLKVTLSLYQDYEWLITAEQEIERYVSIEGQIGPSVIDVPGRRVVIKVPKNLDITSLNLTSLKLGPEGLTTYSPEVQLGETDFSHSLHLEVSYFGKTEEWTIYVEQVDQIVSTSQVDAWAMVIWAYGEGPADGENGFQYREETSTDWIDVPQEWITHEGGAFRARIIHLTPLTRYVVRAVSGENIGNEVSVTTETTRILPDGSFDQWWLKNGKIWCPWDENGMQYWDTGNTGAATLGQSNVTPTDYTATGSGKAAKLESRFVGIGALGKIAAGSIFTGVFKKVDGTNGILDFGRPWTERPTRLRGYYQYHSEPVNYASAEYKWMMGRPDSCHIYVLLTDWTAPFEIRTNPKNQHLLDFSSPSIIAYGGVKTSAGTDHYIEFDIPLEYRSTSRKPVYMLVCAAASLYGDYFTAGAGSVLYLDQLTFEYDYP